MEPLLGNARVSFYLLSQTTEDSRLGQPLLQLTALLGKKKHHLVIRHYLPSYPNARDGISRICNHPKLINNSSWAFLSTEYE
ncbi:hypothetical protein DTO212C5_5865 [Paecilomyces variotii]|nr:hypothetical protein DTO212C5_5865 [Paecilomyces variotii]